MYELAVDGKVVAPLELATSARARSKGLLGRTGLAGALWLAPARQVHTFRMRFPIDVAHVDKEWYVIHIETLPPGKIGRWSWRTKGVLEAEAGSFQAWDLKVGSRVEFTSPDGVAG